MEIDQAALAEMVADRIVDDYNFKALVHEQFSKKMDKQVSDAVQSIGKELIDGAMGKLRASVAELKLRRTNNWGEPNGEAISLPQWCEEQIIQKTKSNGGMDSSELHREVRSAASALVVKHVDALLKEHTAAIRDFISKQIAETLLEKQKVLARS